MKDQFGGGWGGGEKLTRSGTWGRCSHNYTHASQRYLRIGYNRCRCSWCYDQIFEDKECCLLQMKCMMSGINSKHQSSFLLSSEVELMLSLAILNKLKSFRWYFLMFANNWIYWEVELLQNVNMKRSNTFYLYVKSFHLTIYWQVSVLYFNPTIFPTYKHYYKIISQGNGKLVAYTPCLKCKVRTLLTC